MVSAVLCFLLLYIFFCLFLSISHHVLNIAYGGIMMKRLFNYFSVTICSNEFMSIYKRSFHFSLFLCYSYFFLSWTLRNRCLLDHDPVYHYVCFFIDFPHFYSIRTKIYLEYNVSSYIAPYLSVHIITVTDNINGVRNSVLLFLPPSAWSTNHLDLADLPWRTSTSPSTTSRPSGCSSSPGVPGASPPSWGETTAAAALIIKSLCTLQLLPLVAWVQKTTVDILCNNNTPTPHTCRIHESPLPSMHVVLPFLPSYIRC